jgi:hypothetical protein
MSVNFLSLGRGQSHEQEWICMRKKKPFSCDQQKRKETTMRYLQYWCDRPLGH